MDDTPKKNQCPKCKAAMVYTEGLDEFSTNELYWFARWNCDNCGHVIRDYEDEFEFPDVPPSA